MNTPDNAGRNALDNILFGMHAIVEQPSQATRLRLCLRDPQTLGVDVTSEQMHQRLAALVRAHPKLNFSTSGRRKLRSCLACTRHILEGALLERPVSAAHNHRAACEWVGS